MLTSPTPRPEAIRARAIESLAPLVADGLALALAVQFAHWNLRGRAFGPLHALFGDAYEALTEYNDRLAERVATLGGVAPGTVEQVLAAKRLPALPTDQVDGFALLAALLPLFHAYAASLSQTAALMIDLGLVADNNALADILEGVEKLGWKLEAHLQG